MNLKTAVSTGHQDAGTVITDVGVRREGFCVFGTGAETHFRDQRTGARAQSGGRPGSVRE